MAEIKIIWSQAALHDIEEIISFISNDSEYYAANFTSKIINAVEMLGTFPQAGRIVPEYNDSNMREILYRNYRVVYSISKNIVEIITVFHGSKILDDL